MKYEISIIIPIFNAENEIKNTISSIINQTFGFEKIELILVDDKSTDNSREVINNYAKLYNNIKAIFLEKNTGNPSTPRNVGMEHASAPYMMFVDADDCLVKDCCENVYDLIVGEDIDIVNFSTVLNFQMVYIHILIRDCLII